MEFQSFSDASKLAVQGNADAQAWVGAWFYSQYSNYAEAYKWFSLSAEQGNAQGLFGLANCYYNGYGVQKNINLAIDYFQKSAQKNHLHSIKVLASGYYGGVDFPKNLRLAKMWAKRGAKLGDKDMQCCLASCYELQKRNRLATKWYLISAQNGNALAQFNVGYRYSVGLGISKNMTQAIFWYQQAVQQNNADAMYNLATCYLQGVGVKQDYKQAYDLYKRASARGIHQATYALALCEIQGLGTPKNYTSAKFWLESIIYSKTADDALKLKAKNMRQSIL